MDAFLLAVGVIVAVCLGAVVIGVRRMARRDARAMLMDDEAWRDGEVAAGRVPDPEFDPEAKWKRDAWRKS